MKRVAADAATGSHLHLRGASAPPSAGQRLMTTSADKGAVRDVSQVEGK